MNEHKKQAKRYLNTVKGQIEGILKMMEEGRYCIDVSNQISASTALLKKANVEMLQGHLQTCVLQAIEKEEDIETKMQEVYDVLQKISK